MSAEQTEISLESRGKLKRIEAQGEGSSLSTAQLGAPHSRRGFGIRLELVKRKVQGRA